MLQVWYIGHIKSLAASKETKSDHEETNQITPQAPQSFRPKCHRPGAVRKVLYTNFMVHELSVSGRQSPEGANRVEVRAHGVHEAF